jgi:dolichol-phosphate mannosyltransferase
MHGKAMPHGTVIIIPTYNERDNLPQLVRCIMAQPVEVDILVVDDNSPDGTGRIADDIAAANPHVHVLHRPGKQGLGRAYIAGFQWALQRPYEFIMEMDADFSHNPTDIPAFLDAARKQDADLVLGTRYLKGIRVINWPLQRLLLSLAAARYVQVITGMPISDPTGGYKCFRRRALEALGLDAVRSNGYSFQIELTHRVWRRGGRIAEVPITFIDRYQGTSKMSPQIVREALWIVWKLWIENALQRHPRPAAPSAAATPASPPTA